MDRRDFPAVRARGVTLIELLSALTIMAILTTLAVPSMAEMRMNAERTAAVNGFFHALFLARSEAIKRGSVVSLCKSADGVTCLGTHGRWSQGWIVFENLDRDEPAQRDAAEPLLAVYSGWEAGSIESNRQSYSFRAHTQAVVNGTVIFCDSRGSAEARAIIISHTGRPRIARRDGSNRPLACT